jgi:hypothetical protein
LDFCCFLSYLSIWGRALLISDEGANLIIEFQSKEFNTNQIISADGSLILAGLCFKGMGIKFNE